MAPRIVVPLDGSDEGERAVPFARALAARWQAGVTLVSVIEVAMEFDAWADARQLSSQDAVQQWIDERRAYLETTAKQFDGRDVQVEVRLGTPAQELVAFIEEVEDAVLVLTSHARTGLAQIVVGSVAFTIVHRVQCPVFVLRREGEDGAVPTPDFASVLVPLDGSELSEQALNTGLQLLGDPKPVLHLVRAVETPRWVTGALNTGLVGDYYEASRGEAEQYLDAQATRLRAAGYTVEVEAQEGRPADIITHRARELGVDQILMATHARSTAGRVFMGSVALSVLQSASTPLLLIRPVEE
jgi:nucleotide-binding universal stress UspA family protein